MRTNTALIRVVFTGILVGAAYKLEPVPGLFGLPAGLSSALVAAVVVAAIIFFEVRIQQASLQTLLGAAIGSVLGILGALLIDGTGCLYAGSNGLQVQFDPNVFGAVASYGTVGLVQDTWRELIPS